jgi:hypothetical protein
MPTPKPLDLLDVATLLAGAADRMPDGARVWVEFNGVDRITLTATHYGAAAQAADALDLPRQHPPREHVQQWARGVNANGKHAVLAVEFIDTQRALAPIWGQETTAA